MINIESIKEFNTILRIIQMKQSRTKIADVLKDPKIGNEVIVKGWVRTFRNNQFISINDGSTIKNIQGVIKLGDFDQELLKDITTGAAIAIKGELVESLGKGQAVEILVNQFEVMGKSDAEEYPLQPKKHSLEFLREKAHLRFRTNTFSAVFRLRHAMAFAVHKFFNDKGFVYLHTPIITGSDAEGAGEMFQVTTLDLGNVPKTENNEIDFKEDFFGKATNLTVSGQLEGELGALALGQIYTFGPTFRAENSNTSRHLAEFWMIEPEVAFADINENMDLSEELLQFLCKYALENCKDDLEFLSDRERNEEKNLKQEERNELSLIDRIQFVLENKFERITYTEAVELLLNSKPYKKKRFKYPVDWGVDLQSEHERYLVEKEFKKPVIITGYPEKSKAFYMRRNDDGKTVAAMDVLFPGIGEIVGGSQREERLEVLSKKLSEFNIAEEELWWYLDSRKFGSVPHSGFGLGFERFIMFITGMKNVRDVIPFPRTPQSADF